MDSLEVYLSRIFLEFFPKPVYSTMVVEKFQINGAKITANTFASQKIESAHFYSCPQAKLSPIIIPQSGIANSSRTAFLEDIFSWAERGGENYGVEKITKINKGIGHKIDSTIFATFTFLVYVFVVQ